MALSGTINGTTSNSSIKAKIEWSATQNISANTSTITATLYYRRTDTGYTTQGTFTGKLKIGSNAKSWSKSMTIASSWVQAASYSKTVSHDDTGKLTISLSATGGDPGTSLTTTSCSGNISLNTIPRASDIALSSSTLVVNGVNTLTATTTKKVATFDDEIVLTFGSYSQTLLSGEAFTIPVTWLNAIPNSTTGTAKVTVTTTNNGSLIGTKTATCTLIVPDDAVPIISALTITEASELPTAFAGRFVQTLSALNVAATAEGFQGSTIAQTTVSFEDSTYYGSPTTTSAVNGSGELPISVTVTDSRGRTSATYVDSINVVPYAPANLSALDYVVGNGQITLTFAGEVSAVDNLNTKELKISYKATDETTVHEQVVPISYSFSQSLVLNLDTTKTYQFTAVLTDSLGGSSRTVTTGVLAMSLRKGGKGVAFGQEATQDGFVCAFDADFVGDKLTYNYSPVVTVNGITTTVEECFASTSIAGASYKNGTITISKAGFIPIAVVGWATTSQYYLPFRLVIENASVGSGTLNYGVYNTSSSARSSYFRATVLWMKGE